MRSGDDRIAKIDVFSFALILFEIVVGLPTLGGIDTSEELGKHPLSACQCIETPGFILKFVSEIVESGLSANPRESLSFDGISEALKENYFRIADGVDFDKVSAFVSLVRFSET
jgi:hypothetical protein